jgi:hypothetical protein
MEVRVLIVWKAVAARELWL